MGRTFYAERAEQEANRIGMKFAYSNDVVQDMSRAYHVDFSDIKVHTDSAADSRVRAAGKDALAQGNELFFGKGIFESSEPEDKALVAHEFAHTMQQGAAGGGEAAVSESAPMGAEQGGIWDWFKGLFSRKPKISEPQLLDTPDVMNGGDFGYRIQGGDQTATKQRFMSTQSRAIYEMARNASPEQLRSDPMLRQMILNDYKTNMAKRLERFEGSTYDSMYSKVLRGDSAGEFSSYRMLLQATMPAEISQQISDNYVRNPVLDENGQQKLNANKMPMFEDNMDELLDPAGELITSNPALMEVLQASMDALGTSSHFSGENEDRLSPMVMNTAVLRSIAPDLIMSRKNKAAAGSLQRAAAGTTSSSAAERFRNLLRRRR